MGSSVSQIQYWRNDGASDNIKEAGPGAVYLSYNVLLGLSVLGGFVGLDHLYLRSPLTFIAKLITNIFTFGTWWLYDATQVIFNRDAVKIFGLGIPGLGPKGIAAGVLAKDIPDKKHMAFFAYALALFAGGIFGLDSFITGDKQTGFIRLMCLIIIIFAPVAIFWWLYKVVMFLFKTDTVIKQNSEFFGAPYTGITFSSMLPFIDTLLSPFFAFKDTILGTATGAVCAATSAVDTAVSTVKTAAEVGSAVVSEGVATAKAIEKLGAAAGQFQFNPQDAMKPIQQTGGGMINDSGVLPYMVIGTFGLIAVSGFILTYRRLRQNGKQHKTDDPPTPSESGVLRESDKKESPNTT
jgi:hypothetical protein